MRQLESETDHKLFSLDDESENDARDCYPRFTYSGEFLCP